MACFAAGIAGLTSGPGRKVLECDVLLAVYDFSTRSVLYFFDEA